MDRSAVTSLLESTVEVVEQNFREQLAELKREFQSILPKQIEVLRPVTIVEGVQSTHTDLNLVKSLPEFRGKISEYPAWREAARFAISYYTEGSEPYYIAMGILRNKITSAANENLSAFNTPLNFKAIITKLDQLYADKRPLHILENQLNTLRQGKMSISEYYDAVDRQLTLILNKNIMTNSSNEQLTHAFNVKARENALRVFISGLKRPLCDTLFSANPPDLPSALAAVQELQHNHERYEFAHTYASGRLPQLYQSAPLSNTWPQPNRSNNSVQYPVPMEIDQGSSCFRQNPQTRTNNTEPFNHQRAFHQGNSLNYENSYQQRSRQQANTFAPSQQQHRRPYANNISNQASLQRQQATNFAQPQQQYKRPYTNRTSTQAPAQKLQRINAMGNEPYSPELDEYEDPFLDEPYCSEIGDTQSPDEINFLG